MKKNIKILIIFSISIVLGWKLGLSTNKRLPIEEHIYTLCHKEDTLSFQIFRRAEQIFRTAKGYFIIFDEHKDYTLMPKKYLLYCDTSLVLKGASTISDIQIVNIDNDTVFAWECDDQYKNHLHDYNDLPSNIKFNIEHKPNKFNGFQSQFEKSTVVDSVKFLADNFSLKIYKRVFFGVFFTNRKEYTESLSSYSVDPKYETEEVPISSLYFDKYDPVIITFPQYNVMNHMVVLDDYILNDFYEDVFKDIKN